MNVKLYITHLDSSVDKTELRKVFEQYGKVISSEIDLYSISKTSKQTGNVILETELDAINCINGLKNEILKGKPILISRTNPY